VWPKAGVEEGGQEGEGKETVALLTHAIGSIITPLHELVLLQLAFFALVENKIK
jgi:hypothetical protein